MCDFISTQEDTITITTFGEYRKVMKKVMRVIKEAHLVERKRRQTSRKRKDAQASLLTQRAKTLVINIKRGGMRREEIEKRLEEIFGKGSRQEIEKATTNEKIAERIEEMTKCEEQVIAWETMRQETKTK